jgi:deferrochelatase/peroxidase EfeB
VSVDLADVQGNVLRGFGHHFARHFALSVGDPAGGRALIGALLPGRPPVDTQVTTAEDWGPNRENEPDHALNVGLTWPGLKALGLPDGLLATFPEAFRQGSAARSSAPDPDFKNGVGLGDTGDGAPANWEVGGPANPPVHILVSLYMRDSAGLARVSQILEGRFAEHGVECVWKHDATAIGDRGNVHFGYRDGIAQPRIKEVEDDRYPDMQPEAGAGDFLLGRGYENTYRGNYLGDIPSVLGDNATYGAFRMQRQDVHGFEAMLDRCAAAAGLHRELIAAKLMGRWRNGTPLSLSPTTAEPQPELAEEELNDFDYAPSPGRRGLYDDTEGLRCPVGAHIRRLNPRGAAVMGMPHSRRILRRSMPYGPALDPDRPDPEPEPERGLIGYFMCGDLEMQFEFIQRVWVNQDISTSGLRNTREAIVGTQPPAEKGGGQFTIPTPGGSGPVVLRDLPNLVTTRGSLYCLLPGIGGLRYLATLGDAAAPGEPAPAAAAAG